MRSYQCDLCGKKLGIAWADGCVNRKGMEFGSFSNTLKIKSWKTIAEQSSQIECAYDLCDDCAKAIHRKLSHIANNYNWRNNKNERKWV